MIWNFDMAAAPRGEHRTVKRIIGKNEVEVLEHIPVTIIAASATGGVVTPSRWLPDQGRWNMFTVASPPIAWQEWPKHPEVSA